MNTTTSRRAVLAGMFTAAAMPVAAASSLSTKAASDRPDPTLRLIEKHRPLQAEAIALGDALEALEQSLPDDVMREPRVAMYPERDGKATIVEETEDYKLLKHEWTGLTGKLHFGESLTDLERNATAISEEHRDAWLADREAAFKRDRRALRRRQRRAGLTQLRNRHTEAIEAEYVVGKELLSTAPTTLEGVMALVRYCVECHETTADIGPDGDDPYRLLASIDTALQSIAVQS